MEEEAEVFEEFDDVDDDDDNDNDDLRSDNSYENPDPEGLWELGPMFRDIHNKDKGAVMARLHAHPKLDFSACVDAAIDAAATSPPIFWMVLAHPRTRVDGNDCSSILRSVWRCSADITDALTDHPTVAQMRPTLLRLVEFHRALRYTLPQRVRALLPLVDPAAAHNFALFMAVKHRRAKDILRALAEDPRLNLAINSSGIDDGGRELLIACVAANNVLGAQLLLAHPAVRAQDTPEVVEELFVQASTLVGWEVDDDLSEMLEVLLADDRVMAAARTPVLRRAAVASENMGSLVLRLLEYPSIDVNDAEFLDSVFATSVRPYWAPNMRVLRKVVTHPRFRVDDLQTTRRSRFAIENGWAGLVRLLLDLDPIRAAEAVPTGLASATEYYTDIADIMSAVAKEEYMATADLLVHDPAVDWQRVAPSDVLRVVRWFPEDGQLAFFEACLDRITDATPFLAEAHTMSGAIREVLQQHLTWTPLRSLWTRAVVVAPPAIPQAPEDHRPFSRARLA